MSPAGTLLRRQGRSERGRAYLIRPTSGEEADDLVELLDSVAAEGEWIAARPGEHSGLEQGLALAALLSGGGLSLALEVEGRLAGHLVVQRRLAPDADSGELAVVVRSGYRDERLGRALLETAVDWAGAVGLRILRLGVFPGNARAISLYRALGFVEEGVRRERVGAAGEEHELLLMRLSIEPRTH